MEEGRADPEESLRRLAPCWLKSHQLETVRMLQQRLGRNWGDCCVQANLHSALHSRVISNARPAFGKPVRAPVNSRILRTSSVLIPWEPSEALSFPSTWGPPHLTSGWGCRHQQQACCQQRFPAERRTLPSHGMKIDATSSPVQLCSLLCTSPFLRSLQ